LLIVSPITAVVTTTTGAAPGTDRHASITSNNSGIKELWDGAEWELVLLTAAAKGGGVCLDGTPGGYYIRRGAPGNNRWVVFFEGGGWCNSDVACASRAHGALGSSLSYASKVPMPDWYEGSQLYATPPFDTATLIHAMYCDGGSWAGQASAPVQVRVNSTVSTVLAVCCLFPLDV
jgi:hypothetical protein